VKKDEVGLEVQDDGSRVRRLIERLSLRVSWRREHFGNGAGWKKRGWV